MDIWTCKTLEAGCGLCLVHYEVWRLAIALRVLPWPQQHSLAACADDCVRDCTMYSTMAVKACSCALRSPIPWGDTRLPSMRSKALRPCAIIRSLVCLHCTQPCSRCRAWPSSRQSSDSAIALGSARGSNSSRHFASTGQAAEQQGRPQQELAQASARPDHSRKQL